MGVQVGCIDREPWWQRVVQAVRRRGDRLALTTIGLLVVVGPALIPRLTTVKTAVLVLGVGIVVLGVVLPSAAEAEVGLQGFRYKRIVEGRDADFAEEFSEAEIAELVRLAMHLGVGQAQAAEIVSDACVRAYGEWHLVTARQPRFVVICHLVRQVVRADRLGLLTDTTGIDGDAILANLGVRDRALLLLHVYQGYDEMQVARMMGEPLEQIRQDLAHALEVLAAEPQTPTVRPS